MRLRRQRRPLPPAPRTLEQALEVLERDRFFRPGQTQISRSRVQAIVDDFQLVRAHSSVVRQGHVRYLTEGHHTTVAATMLGVDGPFMGALSGDAPVETGISWHKRRYQVGKRAIRVVD